MFPTMHRTPSQTRYAERLQYELDDLAHRASAMRAEAYRLADEREMIFRSLARFSSADELARCEEVDRGGLRAEAERILAVLGAVTVSVSVARDAAQAAAYADMSAHLVRLEDEVAAAAVSGGDPPVTALEAAVNSASPDPTGPVDEKLQSVILSCAKDDQKEFLRRLRALAEQARAVANEHAAMSPADRAAKAAAHRAAVEAAAAAAAAAVAADAAVAAAAAAAAAQSATASTAESAASAKDEAAAGTGSHDDESEEDEDDDADTDAGEAGTGMAVETEAGTPARRTISVASPKEAHDAAVIAPTTAARTSPAAAAAAAAAAPARVPVVDARAPAKAAAATATKPAPRAAPPPRAPQAAAPQQPRARAPAPVDPFSAMFDSYYAPQPAAVDMYGRPVRVPAGYYSAPPRRVARPAYGYDGGYGGGYPFGGFW